MTHISCLYRRNMWKRDGKGRTIIFTTYHSTTCTISPLNTCGILNAVSFVDIITTTHCVAPIMAPNKVLYIFYVNIFLSVDVTFNVLDHISHYHLLQWVRYSVILICG